MRRGGDIDEAEGSRNHNKSKVRYRGLAKNATRSFVVLGLANIYLARQRLVA